MRAASLTPHRDAVESGLRALRAQVEGRPTAGPAEDMERRLKLEVSESVMRAFADGRDQRLGIPEFLAGLNAAYADALASVIHSTCPGSLHHQAKIASVFLARFADSLSLRLQSEDDAIAVRVDDTPGGRS